MITNRLHLKLVLLGVVATMILIAPLVTGRDAVVKDVTSVAAAPKIRPDYTGTVIPPNIAPLNFVVCESGENYVVKIHSAKGVPFEVSSETGKVIIPPDKWSQLLNANRGGQLYFDVFVKAETGWKKYETIANTVARQDIDSHVVYRLIHPLYNWFKHVGIYQRDLTGYDESTVIHGRSFANGCVNCHTFLNNDPRHFFVSTRTKVYGSSTLCVNDETVNRIGTKFTYTAWHPTGRLAAFSVNKVCQFFHSAASEVRDVADTDSLIACYKLDSQAMEVPKPLCKQQRLETYPTWSPDGKFLYFCSAPRLWMNTNKIPPDHYDRVKYDLMRVSYDIETGQWGEAETVLSAEQTGLSILQPRISPDGRWLLFCMCDYGCFPVLRPSADLYVMDLHSLDEAARPRYHRLSVNSNQSDSWHSWSSNSRWIIFSSKRPEGTLTRLYISYVDASGKAGKPFLMPQKDPQFYESFLKVYNVPEFTTGPIEVDWVTLGRAARSEDIKQVIDPVTGASPQAGGADSAYREQ